MAYLVTGGTGFIGSYVVRSLLRAGQRVVAYDLVPDENVIRLVCSADELARINIVAGDILDVVHLYRVIKEHRIRRVLHLAALLSDISQSRPALSVRVNCDGLNNVFEAARFFELEKVVWISTGGVFGPAKWHKQEFVPDNGAHYPVHVYSACKSLNEFMAHHYYDSYGVNNTGLRFGMVYGFGRMRGGASFGTELMRKAALGQPHNVPYADTILDWLHVEDAAQAVVLASQAQRTETRTLSVVGDFASVRQVAAIVKSLHPEASLTLSPGLALDLQFAKPDGTASKREIGFEPKYTLQKGVRKTINEYRRRAKLSFLPRSSGSASRNARHTRWDAPSDGRRGSAPGGDDTTPDCPADGPR